jgi:hypothetical protein
MIKVGIVLQLSVGVAYDHFMFFVLCRFKLTCFCASVRQLSICQCFTRKYVQATILTLSCSNLRLLSSCKHITSSFCLIITAPNRFDAAADALKREDEDRVQQVAVG